MSTACGVLGWKLLTDKMAEMPLYMAGRLSNNCKNLDFEAKS
jgi:hypothetical protein